MLQSCTYDLMYYAAWIDVDNRGGMGGVESASPRMIGSEKVLSQAYNISLFTTNPPFLLPILAIIN